MADSWAGALAAAYLGGLLLSWVVEALLQPRPAAPWRRPPAAWAAHTGTWTLAFAFTLLLYQRPVFAAINALALELVIVVVSNAKYKSLREPFVYADFEYFTDAIRHPRLYLPFLNVWSAVLPPLVFALACIAAFRYETSLPSQMGSAGAYLAVVAALALAGAWLCRARPGPMAYDAIADLRAHGLLACLWAYARAERLAPALAPVPWPVFPPGAALPDLVSVQSESFFDPRPFYPALRPELLAGFDKLCAESWQYGQTSVPAWGANTVRSEFEFLTGLPAESLGVHRFQPYRRLARQGVPALANHLRQQGYRTVCIHPYHPGFYRRDTILPLLGFDTFISLDAFTGSPNTGPYIGDAEVARKALSLLNDADPRPIYLHLITMENHGPLHWEKAGHADHQATTRAALPAGCDDLVVYARHLRNADAMFGMLADGLRGRGRPASLCVFGDHVPIMAGVYQALGEPAGTTPYLIWANSDQADAQRRDIALSDLATAWLRQAAQQAKQQP
ncbi:LTA synthase family protein [Bordetella petrii]|uniref:LTA synthase family protein n=1 Tax=Bordetella petrii TaxID=94624 RepID=UPI001E588476|nr:LTA synthase family protein [Bordetella petrii]MCD0501742.1 LTA synthase family protein [Bordetella petrii]